MGQERARDPDCANEWHPWYFLLEPWEDAPSARVAKLGKSYPGDANGRASGVIVGSVQNTNAGSLLKKQEEVPLAVAETLFLPSTGSQLVMVCFFFLICYVILSKEKIKMLSG